MLPHDIAAVVRVQHDSYVHWMVEPAPVIAARLQRCPDTAWVAVDSSGVFAYLVCYRSACGRVTPLGATFEASPNPDSLYIHDLAVGGAAGSGIGAGLVRHAWDAALADGLRYSSLVSVQNSQAFWERFGYRRTSLADDPVQQDCLAAYGRDACYMVASLSEVVRP